jgi:lipid A 4'-phosphatase
MGIKLDLMRKSQTPRIFWLVCGASIGAALIPTLWPSLDLEAASLFYGNTPHIASASWWWVEVINDAVPALFRIGLLTALLAWIFFLVRGRKVHLRFALLFVITAGILGPGAMVNWGFKENWQRARPYQVAEFGGAKQFTRAGVMTDQCDNNCSFVSGHVACGFFFSAILLVHRKRKVMWVMIGTASGLFIGFSRMSAMAHWLSDVLWAYPITLLTSWAIWKAMQWVYRKPLSTVG